jgi:hypothetical protein
MADITPPPVDQAALLWPIQAKGAVTRILPAGNPDVNSVYSNSMEQGRFLEASIADANTQLLQSAQDLARWVSFYNNVLSPLMAVGTSNPGQQTTLGPILINPAVAQATSQITQLVAQVQQNITKLLAMQTSMLMMIQADLNALANLLNNICNWGLPSLPSIPNLLPDTVWNWNGFTFSPLAAFAALKSNINFSFNFSFSQCSLGTTAPPSALNTDPATLTTYSGLTYGTVLYNPPLGGQPSPVGQDLTNPAFIALMQGTPTPVYGPNFNPNTSMLGAVPDPHTIISNYQMPAATYIADIVSIAPQLRSNTVFLTDPDYLNPNYTVRDPQLRKDLVHFITLADIVASNYDPFVVSAWLIYLYLDRTARGGVWIPNFQAVYNTYLQPSIATLSAESVPWNDVLGQTNYEWMGTWSSTVSYAVNDVVVFNGVNYYALVANTDAEPDTNPTDWATPLPADTIYSDAPVIALIATLQAMTPNQLSHTLWQLSYIEAGILGYTRNSQWDTTQDAIYLAGPTGSDLDYKPTTITTSQSSLILGEGTAEFPVPITFPSVMKTTLDQVIALATVNIQNDLTYLSPRLGNRYTYNQFAVATQVDRFSQFWRDFSTNLTAFLAQDPYLVQFAITYPEILDGALDPLAIAPNVAAYQSLLLDVATRNRSWTPGTPLLNIPIQPIVSYQNSSSPTVNTNGWISPTQLDPAAFLARPDIAALPIPVQTAMLRTNLSYAGLQTYSANMQNSIAQNIANAEAVIATILAEI